MSNTFEERVKRAIERDRASVDRHVKQKLWLSTFLSAFAIVFVVVGRICYWLFFSGSVPSIREVPWVLMVWPFVFLLEILSDSRRTEIRDERLIRIEVQLELLAISLEVARDAQRDYMRDLHESLQQTRR